jgi:NhaP-type Na+/H+ or K+/H+ antiporter
MTDIFHETAQSWFDFQSAYILYMTIGGVVLLYAMLEKIMKRWLLSELVVSICVGMLVGVFPGYVYELININNWIPGVDATAILEEVARLSLSVQLVATAIQLPPMYIFRAYKPLFGVIGIVLLATFFTGGLLCWGLLFSHFSFVEALLVGALQCSTDPVIAASVVAGNFARKKLSTDLRLLLSAESGINDGIAYPVVMICLLYMKPLLTGRMVWAEWFLKVLLYDVGVSILLGFTIGWVVGKVYQLSHKIKLNHEDSFLGLTIALTLLVLGVLRILNTDDILGVFVSGVGFNYSMKDTKPEVAVVRKSRVQEAIDLIFTISVFIFFGMALPYHGIRELGWLGGLYCLLLLLVRRIVFVMIIYPWFLHPYLTSWKEALFYGWFGPIGIACLFYSTMVVQRLQNYEQQTGKPINNPLRFYWIGSEMVLCSTVVYGLTDVPLTNLLYRFHKPIVASDEETMLQRHELQSIDSLPPRPSVEIKVDQSQDTNEVSRLSLDSIVATELQISNS